MPHYHAYYESHTEEQFAADEYFQQWVLAENRANNHFWSTFLQRYPDKFDDVLDARRLVKELAISPYSDIPLSSDEKKELKDSIYLKLQLEDTVVSADDGRKRRTLIYGMLAAAAVLIVAAGLYLFIPSPVKESPLLTEHTLIKEIKEITLPDGSVVVLNANSSLKYSAHFSEDSTRVVYLTGNAYFKVKKMSGHRPFIVHADQLSIRVTGTEFNVNARTKATDIVLTSGRVNVTLKDDSRSTAYMEAGERLKLDTLKHRFVTTAANTELYTTAWKEKEWHFQETTLDNIAELIREYYGMDMVFTNSAQQKLMITAIVSVNDFSTLINVIAKTLNIKIKEEENNQLLIY